MIPRILVVSQEDVFAQRGGSAIRTAAIVRALASHGEVTLVIADGKGRRQLPADLDGVPLAHVEAVPFIRRGWRHRASQLLKVVAPRIDMRFTGVAKAISRVADGRPFDVAVVSYTFLVHASRILRVFARRLVLDSHNVEWRTRQQHADRSDGVLDRARWTVAARMLRRFELRDLGRYGRVWACSADDAAWYREQGAEAVVVPNVARESARPVSPPSTGEPRVLFIGALGTIENHRAALWLLDEVLPRLRARAPGAEVIIAGRAPRADLQSRASPGVRIIADPDELTQLYAWANVAAVPLLEGSGTRIKVLEAFANHRPVVSTPVGTAGLEIESGRHALLAADPTTFADALYRAATDVGLSDALVDAGSRLFAARYSPDALRVIVAAAIEEELRWCA